MSHFDEVGKLSALWSNGDLSTGEFERLRQRLRDPNAGHWTAGEQRVLHHPHFLGEPEQAFLFIEHCARPESTLERYLGYEISVFLGHFASLAISVAFLWLGIYVEWFFDAGSEQPWQLSMINYTVIVVGITSTLFVGRWIHRTTKFAQMARWMGLVAHHVQHPAEGDAEADLEAAPAQQYYAGQHIGDVELSRLVEWGEIGLKLWRSHPRLRGRRVAIERALAFCRSPDTEREAKLGWGGSVLYIHALSFAALAFVGFIAVYPDVPQRAFLIVLFSFISLLQVSWSMSKQSGARFARNLGLVITGTLYLANGEEALPETFRTYPTVKRLFAPVLARPYFWLAIGVLLIGGLTMVYQEMDPELRWKTFGAPGEGGWLGGP